MYSSSSYNTKHAQLKIKHESCTAHHASPVMHRSPSISIVVLCSSPYNTSCAQLTIHNSYTQPTKLHYTYVVMHSSPYNIVIQSSSYQHTVLYVQHLLCTVQLITQHQLCTAHQITLFIHCLPYNAQLIILHQLCTVTT
jgi:hypothetical protein